MRRAIIASLGTLLLFLGVLVIVGIHVNHINVVYGAEPVSSTMIDDQNRSISVSELPPQSQKYAIQTLESDGIHVEGWELIVLKNKMLTVTSGPNGWHLGWPDWGMPFQEHPYFRTGDGTYYQTITDRDSLDDFNQTPLTITGVVTIILGALLPIWSAYRQTEGRENISN